MYESPGTDIASGPIWTDYITFLKSLPVRYIILTLSLILISCYCSETNRFFILVQALNLNEDLHRKNALRKVYHRAILTPTHHVEQLWKDYENFENSVNRQLVNFLKI